MSITNRGNDMALLEAPLKEVDPLLNETSRNYRMVLYKNKKGSISRSLEWSQKNKKLSVTVERYFEIYLNENEDGFDIGGMVSFDKFEGNEGVRHWKNIVFEKGAKPPLLSSIKKNIENYINQINSVIAEDLPPVVQLRSPGSGISVKWSVKISKFVKWLFEDHN